MDFESAVNAMCVCICVSGLEEVAALASLNSFQPIPRLGDHPLSSAPHRSDTPSLHLLTLTPLCSPFISSMQPTNQMHLHWLASAKCAADRLLITQCAVFAVEHKCRNALLGMRGKGDPGGSVSQVQARSAC